MTNWPGEPQDILPYRIELWQAGGDAVERVLGGAVSAPLAQAIYQSAQQEYPGRHITLRHANRIVATNQGSPDEPP